MKFEAYFHVDKKIKTVSFKNSKFPEKKMGVGDNGNTTRVNVFLSK